MLILHSSDNTLVLSEISIEDVAELFKLIDRNRDFLSQYGENTSRKYPTVESLRESIVNPKNPRRKRFVIKNSDGVIVGSINITPDDDNQEIFEIGYYVGKEYSGHGYATKAVKVIIEYVFHDLHARKVYGLVHPDNIASQNVLVRNGFVREHEQEGKVEYALYNR